MITHLLTLRKYNAGTKSATGRALKASLYSVKTIGKAAARNVAAIAIHLLRKQRKKVKTMSELPKDIQRKLAKLEALEAGGVDNWEFYDEAIKEWRAKNENEETAEDIVKEILAEIHDYIEEPAGRGCGYGIKPEGYEAAVKILLERFKEFRIEQ